MNDYSRYYATLRVSRDVDWKTLRARYKRLIGQWHPDRFPAGASETERGIAEERSKEITLAYQVLERYYRDHGVLPPLEPASAAVEAKAPRDLDTATATPPEPELAPRATPRGPAAPAPRRRYRGLIVACALIAGLVVGYHYLGEIAGDPTSVVAGSRPAQPASQEPTPEPQRDTGTISAGSTVGDVYEIQGIPTRTEGEIWHYGKSSIRFANGKVVSWIQHPDNPLRIARDQPFEQRDGYFDIGSSKDDVRSVQGTPVTETDTVWDYGPSRVYFENNRVVRWEASPLQPLRVPR